MRFIWAASGKSARGRETAPKSIVAAVENNGRAVGRIRLVL